MDENLTFETYQLLSRRTMPKDKIEGSKNYAMGLNGEAGEVSELFKKHFYHGHDLPKEKLVEEIGDVLHYLTGLCELNGFTLKAAAVQNINKLMARYPNGFTEKDSVNRHV